MPEGSMVEAELPVAEVVLMVVREAVAAAVIEVAAVLEVGVLEVVELVALVVVSVVPVDAAVEPRVHCQLVEGQERRSSLFLPGLVWEGRWEAEW